MSWSTIVTCIGLCMVGCAGEIGREPSLNTDGQPVAGQYFAPSSPGAASPQPDAEPENEQDPPRFSSWLTTAEPAAPRPSASETGQGAAEDAVAEPSPTPVEGPKGYSAMSAPSFESDATSLWFDTKGRDAFDIADSLESDVPYPTRCERVSSVDYTVWEDNQRFSSVEPSDGAWLALCTGDGALMRGFVVPPPYASTLVIDVGIVDFNTGRAGGLVALLARPVDGGVKLPLTTAQAINIGDEPSFHEYRLPINPTKGTYWIEVEYADPGGRSGAVFLDNLRFE